MRSVAASTGRSKSWVGRHVPLYRDGGEEALEPRKRGPASALNRTAPEVEDAIVALHKQLSDQGPERHHRPSPDGELRRYLSRS